MTDAPQDQPELFEAFWDRDQVDALFADLKQGANIRQVQVRTISGNNRPSDTTVGLEQAHQLLDHGDTKAIQVYYDYDGNSWCDTLMPTPEAIRIVRTTIPSDR